MKMKILKYKWLFLLILLSCKAPKEKLIVWEFVDSYEEKKDSCLFRKSMNGDTTIFEYDFSFDNFINPLTFKILRDSSLMIDRNEYIKPKEIIKTNINKKQTEIVRYELPNSPPGGQGSWLFTFQFGMIGNGLYVGEKMIVKKFGELLFETDSIAELMKYMIKSPPPPPPSTHNKYWPDSLSESDFEEIEKELNKNAP